MALSAGDKATVLALRNHYFKAKDNSDPSGIVERDWPVDAAGTPYRSDGTTPADAGGGDPEAVYLSAGHKSKIGSTSQKVQDDMNEALDLIVTLGGV